MGQLEPTRQEIHDVHKALEIIAFRARLAVQDVKDETDYEQLIRSFLPPLPRPTMAEIEWDDDKHYLAEAEHPGWGKVIMLGIGEEKLIDVFIPHLRKSNCIVPRRNLTPTGRRYVLQEGE